MVFNFFIFFLFFDNKMCAEASSGTHSSVATQKGMKRWSCGAETPLKNTKSRLSSRWLRHLIQSTRDLVKSIPLMINTLFFFFFFTFKYYFFNSILPKYYSLILLLLIAALKFLLSANATQLLGLLRLYKLTLRFFISITKGEITGGKAAFTGSCLQVQDRYVVITDSSNSWARWLGWVNTHIFFQIIMKIIHRKRIHM